MDVIFASSACVTCVFYILVVLISKTWSTNKLLLLAFITTLCLSTIPIVLNMYYIHPPRWLNASFGLLWGPLLYFYIISLLKKNVKYKYFIVHSLPFLVFMLLTLFYDFSVIPPPPNAEIPPNPDEKGNYQILFTILQCASLLGYSAIALYIIHKHNNNIKNHFSYKDVHLTIRWSYVIIIFFVSSYLLVALAYIITSDFINIIPFDLHILLISSFIYILGYLGIQQQPVYLSMSNRTNSQVDVIKSSAKEKYYKNKLSDTLKEDYKLKLLNYLTEEKPYLQPKLSIDELSVALNIQKHFISQIINDSLNHTFYSLINSYRVDEVKKRIMIDKNDKFTLLSIALDSGFNSKSGFNKNFKLETGMTPLEYRNAIKNNISAI